MTVTIHKGDCREILRSLPDESVHCVVTSPPYFGLRDYGMAGQIGSEAEPGDYIQSLVVAFREARRVLRRNGVFFLNLGDTYRDRQRLLIPARAALALQADGWILRDEIVWEKPNAMPASVTDRTTPSHEMVYMFARSASYAYDFEALREPALSTRDRGRPNGAATFEKFGKNTSCGTAPDGLRRKRSVWSVHTTKFKGAHFAVFPPDLVRPCILAGCPVGGIVLDPFGGSGTTAEVAVKLGRGAILIELNPEYAAIAEHRIKRAELIEEVKDFKTWPPEIRAFLMGEER